MQKDISCKWKPKERWSYSYIRQNRLQNEDCNKRQTRVLHNDKGVNPRGYITFVYFYAPSKGTPKYIKQILTDLKRQTDNTR